MQIDDILIQLANGNYHREPSLRTLKIGTTPLFESLVQEAMDIAATHKPSVVSAGHITNWTNPIGTVEQWSLWNSHGRTHDTSDDFNYVMKGKRAVSAGLQTFAELLPSLVNMRLNCLHPDSALSPHEEHLPRAIGQDQVALRARFHLPLATNDDTEMLADNHWFKFKADSSIYLFNNGCVHAAHNSGTTLRYHLVWDMLMTAEATDTMFASGNKYIDVELSTVDISRQEDVSDYAREAGMSHKDFSDRKLILHP